MHRLVWHRPNFIAGKRARLISKPLASTRHIDRTLRTRSRLFHTEDLSTIILVITCESEIENKEESINLETSLERQVKQMLQLKVLPNPMHKDSSL